MVLAQGVASQSRPGGGRLGGTGRARDIREPEPGRSQAGTCHWMKVHRGRQQRGREAVPGSDRMCPARGALLGRSEEAAEVGGLRKPECPHAWEPHFLAASPLEIPQVPPPWHGAHIPPCRPLPMRVSSAAPPQVKNLLQVPELEWELWLPDTESSGFSAHFYHLPRKKARSRNEGKLTSEFSLGDPQGVKADPHSLTSLACPWHPHWSRACI